MDGWSYSINAKTIWVEIATIWKGNMCDKCVSYGVNTKAIWVETAIIWKS